MVGIWNDDVPTSNSLVIIYCPLDCSFVHHRCIFSTETLYIFPFYSLYRSNEVPKIRCKGIGTAAVYLDIEAIGVESEVTITGFILVER
jgi:hypothetical protein